jgi:hypothetical protein
LNKNEQSEKTALLFELVINALKDSGFRFDAVFTQYRNYIINRKKIEFGKSESPEKLMRDSTAEATALVIEIATEICYAHPDYIDLVCSETSGISKVISSFVPIYGLGSGRFIKECLANSPKELQNLASYAFKEGKAELPTAKERAVKIGTDIKDRAEKISSGIKEQVDKIFKK